MFLEYEYHMDIMTTMTTYWLHVIVDTISSSMMSFNVDKKLMNLMSMGEDNNFKVVEMSVMVVDSTCLDGMEV